MDIDLENIVYYKDDTHYFFMTAKKDSLLKKGVLKSVRGGGVGRDVCVCWVRWVASFPAPAQLFIACSTEKRGEPGMFPHVRMSQ